MKIDPESYLAHAVALGLPLETIKKVMHLGEVHVFAAVNDWLRKTHQMNVAVNFSAGGYQFCLSRRRSDADYFSRYMEKYSDCWIAGFKWAFSILEAKKNARA